MAASARERPRARFASRAGQAQIGAEDAGNAQPLQAIHGQVADLEQEGGALSDHPVYQVEPQDGEDQAEIGAIVEVTGAGVAGKGRRLP